VLARQRQALILEKVRRSGAVRVSELAQDMSVSEMTVRRDLDSLAARGLLEKVYGGATLSRRPAAEEPGFEAKSIREQAEKEAIARRAASEVRPGYAIALSGGTTTYTLARHLDQVEELTVVTNSIRVAEVLSGSGRPDRTVILTGGIRTPSDALVGPVAVAAVRSLHVDAVIMGVHGMAERTGFTTPNLMESEVNRVLMGSASRRIVVADHTKWGEVGLSSFAALDEADLLISDDGLPTEAVAVLSEAVGSLVLVSVSAEAACA